MRLESSTPVEVRMLAHFARRTCAERLRKQGSSQSVTALLGGWDEVRNLFKKAMSLFMGIVKFYSEVRR